ncbi:MAG: HAD-IIIA family hydrolase [Bacteroidales bacterium]|nr:HAD-IIIA family hydrolase [Bacteroidales bacterium]
MTNLKEGLLNIKAFAFDVDGVFSPTQVIMHPFGEPMRSMNIRDGYAIQLAVKKKYPIAVITGARSKSVKKRFLRLGVTDIYLNSYNKIEAFDDFINKYDLNIEQILYMGDDLPDFEIMKKAGFPTCPADAAEEIKSISKYISDKNGGEGCVRDILEQVMKVQGKWLDTDAFSW